MWNLINTSEIFIKLSIFPRLTSYAGDEIWAIKLENYFMDRVAEIFFPGQDCGHKFNLIPYLFLSDIPLLLSTRRESSMNIACNFVGRAKEHGWQQIWPSSIGGCHGLVFLFPSSLRFTPLTTVGAINNYTIWTSFLLALLSFKQAMEFRFPAEVKKIKGYWDWDVLNFEIAILVARILWF